MAFECQTLTDEGRLHKIKILKGDIKSFWTLEGLLKAREI